MYCISIIWLLKVQHWAWLWSRTLLTRYRRSACHIVCCIVLFIYLCTGYCGQSLCICIWINLLLGLPNLTYEGIKANDWLFYWFQGPQGFQGQPGDSGETGPMVGYYHHYNDTGDYYISCIIWGNVSSAGL